MTLVSNLEPPTTNLAVQEPNMSRFGKKQLLIVLDVRMNANPKAAGGFWAIWIGAGGKHPIYKAIYQKDKNP